MLIFTSGTSGDPKAVRITHEKVAFPGVMLADRFGDHRRRRLYVSMPLFHSNAVMAGYGAGRWPGATVALARRFTACGFLPDVRRFGATYANYVGKPLTYVLATPERADDADNPLRIVFGNEAAERDIEAFGTRFGCRCRRLRLDRERRDRLAASRARRRARWAGRCAAVRVLDPPTGAGVPARRARTGRRRRPTPTRRSASS